eukprot:m.100896 g.100896  ORF g.100896 m.100896 type:complete len:653 (+) comp27284_c0_seq1:96-2054(+)
MVQKSRKGTRRRKADETENDYETPVGSAIDEELVETAEPTTAFVVGVIVFLVHLACYTSTVSPSILGGDSGELISVSHELGVAHPPGYPTFVLVANFFSSLVPFGTVAWRINILSAIFASFAGLLLHCSTVALTGSLSAGVVSVALFSFSRLQWLYSVTGEVFALNNLFTAVLVYQSIKFHLSPTLSRALAGAFLCGFALTNQHTSVLFIVIIAPWVLWRGRELNLLKPMNVAALIVVTFIGLSPYLFTYISAVRNQATMTWGDQRTLRGFWKHLSREEYGTFSLAKGDRESASFTRAIQMHLESLSAETFFICPLVSLLGILAPMHSSRVGAKIPIVGSLLFYMWFFNWRANLDITNPLLKGVQERFWMQPNLVLALFAGVGFHTINKVLRRKQSGIGFVAPCLAVLLLSAQIGKNYEERNESSNVYIQQFGHVLLKGLPQDAILLTLGDLPGNAARYVQTCENVRPDIKLIDLEMMTYEWYLPMLAKSFPGVVFPGSMQVYRHHPDAFNMKQFFDANIDKFDIFVYENLNAEDSTWTDDYELWRHGHARAIKRKGTRVIAKDWLESAMKGLPNFSLPSPQKYDNRTWENVVYEGALGAPVFLAIFFEHRAKEYPQDAVALNKAAAEVYDWLFSSPHFENHQELFWQKMRD